MLTREDLKSLSEIDSPGFPVISFYWQINRKQAEEENHPRALRDFVRDAEDKAQSMYAAQAESVRTDLRRIESLLADERVLGTHSLGVIASSGAGIWKEFHLPEVPQSMLTVGDSPHIKPLFQVFDNMHKYCVLLVNKERARLFLVSMGEITDYTEIIETNLPPKHDQGGWSQARFQRHHEYHVMHHVKRAAEVAFDLFQNEGFDRLITGGTEEAATLLPDYLHSYVKDKLAGTVSLDVDTTTDEVLDAVAEIDRRLKDETERRTVIALKDTLGAKGPAVSGVESTLRALEQGQVMTLVVSSDLEASGSYCSGCGTYSSKVDDECPGCGGKGELVPDLVQQMLIETIRQDGDIEFIYSEELRSAMEAFGKVGALLRYAVAT